MVKRYVVWYLVGAMFVIGMAPRLEAAFVSSEALVTAFSTRAVDTEKIKAALEQGFKTLDFLPTRYPRDCQTSRKRKSIILRPGLTI
jgi:hypothetical protein